MSYKANIWKMYLFKFLISLHFVGGVLVPFFLDWGQEMQRILVPGGHAFVAANPMLSQFVWTALIQAGFEKRGEIVRHVRTFRGGDRPKAGGRKPFGRKIPAIFLNRSPDHYPGAFFGFTPPKKEAAIPKSAQAKPQPKEKKPAASKSAARKKRARSRRPRRRSPRTAEKKPSPKASTQES